MATGSGTGLPASATTSTFRLTDLRARVRAALPSVFEWPNATVDGWIADAIREYSQAAPRMWRYTLTLTTGTQAYALPSDKGLLAIRSVEYPAGEEPPEFVNEVEEWSPAFGNEDAVFALRGVADTTVIGEDTAPASIVFAQTVTTGETAIITYRGLHTIPAVGEDAAQISVPQPFWRVLILYCVWRAWDNLAMDAGLIAGETAGSLGELGKMAMGAWEKYARALAEAASAATVMGGGGGIVTWGGVGL